MVNANTEALDINVKVMDYRVNQIKDDRLTEKNFLLKYRNNSTWCSQMKETLCKLHKCS